MSLPVKGVTIISRRCEGLEATIASHRGDENFGLWTLWRYLGLKFLASIANSFNDAITVSHGDYSAVKEQAFLFVS